MNVFPIYPQNPRILQTGWQQDDPIGDGVPLMPKPYWPFILHYLVTIGTFFTSRLLPLKFATFFGRTPYALPIAYKAGCRI